MLKTRPTELTNRFQGEYTCTSEVNSAGMGGVGGEGEVNMLFLLICFFTLVVLLVAIVLYDGASNVAPNTWLSVGECGLGIQHSSEES